MVWAIDLDDGTLIKALGDSMGKKKKNIPPTAALGGSDFGTGWPDEL